MSVPSNEHPEYEQFVCLFNRYKMTVHDYVQAITGDHHTAEEITQEVFVKIWKKRAALGQISNLDGYVFRMARNQSMDYFRKAALDTRLINELKNKTVAHPHSLANPLDYKETEMLIDRAVASLSPQRRRVYQLSRQQGWNLEEIAAEMQLSANTVKNHLVRALREIRDYLIQHHPDVWLSLLASCILHKHPYLKYW